MLRATDQMEAERQESGTSSVGQEAEVANAHEAGRQQVEQKASQELFLSQGHESVLVAVGRSRASEK